MPSARTDLSCIGGLRERISKKFLSIHYKFIPRTAPDKSEKKKKTLLNGCICTLLYNLQMYKYMYLGLNFTCILHIYAHILYMSYF